jgi:2-alkyl-3-oxoalkanoate reductase
VKVLVTGANGFLGRHVVPALLSRGHVVRALVRPSASLDGLGWRTQVEVVREDLCSPVDLASAFDGVDVLVHLAAKVAADPTGPGGDSTVTGTERLLGAMAGTACRRLVLASSFAVYDWSAIRGVLDESAPLEPAVDLPQRDDYSIAKALQEQATRRLAEAHGWQLCVLRPGFIWGRDHGYVAGCGQQIGPLHVVIGPTSRLPLTHVENCADLFALAASDPRADGQTFNVVDGEGETAWRFLGNHLRRSGQRVLRLPMPYGLAFGIVRFASATILRGRRGLPHILVPCRFEARLKPLRHTNRRAREVLGWQPPFDYAECLRRTYDPALPA